MAKLDIKVYSFRHRDLTEIDDRILLDERIFWDPQERFVNYICRICQIPAGSAGEIIEKILCDNSIRYIRFSGAQLSERAIKTIIFQKFKLLQSNFSLDNFNVNTIEEGSHIANTVLHWAVICQDVKMVEFLLESGAEEVKNSNKSTPSSYAKFFGSEEMQKVFPQWDKIKTEALSQRIQTFAFAYESKMEKNMPLLPIELVKMIGEKIKPSFNTPKPPASLPIGPHRQ